MALEIVWTEEAEQGYDDIIDYLTVNFTPKEIQNFIHKTQDFLESLSKHPGILEKTEEHVNVHRGSLNKYTILTYQVQQQEIIIVSIRSSRQKPE